MRHIKRYSTFNLMSETQHPGNFIPDDWIILKSIGHVFDPNEGIVYPMYRKSISDKIKLDYDVDAGSEIEVSNLGEGDELSNEDRETILKYVTKSNELVEKNIDMNLIQDIEDILIDVIDNSPLSLAKVVSGLEVGTIDIFTRHKGKNDSRNYYQDLFPNRYNMAKDSDKVLHTFELMGIRGCDKDILADSLTSMIFYLKENGYKLLNNKIGDITIPDKIEDGLKSRIDGRELTLEDVIVGKLRLINESNVRFVVYK